MSQGNPADRRQHRRLVAQVPARFGMEGRMREGAIIDLSEGGVQIRAADSFAVGLVVDIFVQFPRRRLRLRARVAWVRGEPPTMGLSFIKPDRSLIAAYDEWVAEARGGPGDAVAAGDSTGAAAPAAMAAMPAAVPVVEPAGPVARHVETIRGNEFDISIDKKGSTWRLIVYASAHRTPTSDPALDRTFPTFASADAALREFLKDR